MIAVPVEVEIRLAETCSQYGPEHLVSRLITTAGRELLRWILRHCCRDP